MKKREKFLSEQIRQRPFSPVDIKLSQICGLQRYHGQLSRGHHEDVRYTLACAYSLGCQLSESGRRQVRFRARPFFRGMYRPPDDGELFKWVLFFVFRAKTGAKRETVGRHAVTLERYRKEGLSPDEVEQRLKDEGGVGKAYKLSAKGDGGSQARGNVIEGDDQQEDNAGPLKGIAKAALRSHGDGMDAGDDDGDDDLELGKPERKKGGPASQRDRPLGKRTTKDLVVKVSGDLMAEALRCSGPLTIYAMASPDPVRDADWMEIEAVRIKRRSV